MQSRVAFGATLQIGKTFHAAVVDTDLLDVQFGSPSAFERYSLALRNALFTVSPPRSLVLFGVLEDSRIISGLLALTHDIYRYLPTLPDPYVSSYTGFVRERGGSSFAGSHSAQQALTGFVKWPDESTLPQDAPDPDDPRAFVYYKLTPVSAYQIRQTDQPATRSFRSGLRTFDQDLPVRGVAETTLHVQPAIAAELAHDANATNAADISGRVAQAVRSGVLRDAVAELARNPTLGHISNPADHVNQVLDATLRSPDVIAAPAAANLMAASSRTEGLFSSAFGRRGLGQDLLMLLDVSTRADQMGVTLGPSIVVDRDERGDTKLRTAGTTLFGTTSSTTGLPLQIMNMDVVTTARHVRAATLPQISWEPVWNVPLAIEGTPAQFDTITVTPGVVVYDNDGIPTRIGSESPYPVPIAPLPVTQARRQGVQRSPHSSTGALGVQPAVRHDRAGRLQPHDREPAGEERAARSQHAPLRSAARGPADQGAAAGLERAREVQPIVQGVDLSAGQPSLVDSRAAAVWHRLSARPFATCSTRSSSQPLATIRWCRSSAWSSRDTARRSSATFSTRRRPSPTSARSSSTSSSGGRGTRSCRSAASSIPSACTWSARSR